MKSKLKRKPIEIIFRSGKPTSVILDINEYQEMLELIEDAEHLKMLQSMRKKTLKFRKLEDFLKEHYKSV